MREEVYAADERTHLEAKLLFQLQKIPPVYREDVVEQARNESVLVWLEWQEELDSAYSVRQQCLPAPVERIAIGFLRNPKSALKSFLIKLHAFTRYMGEDCLECAGHIA